jgi:hypothetical protein
MLSRRRKSEHVMEDREVTSRLHIDPRTICLVPALVADKTAVQVSVQIWSHGSWAGYSSGNHVIRVL